MSRYCSAIGLLLLVVLALASNAISQEENPVNNDRAARTVPGDPVELVSFVLSAISRERHKLVSGVCLVTGSFDGKRPSDPSTNLDGPIKGMIAFDNDKIHYDYTRPGWVVDTSSIQKGGAATSNVKAQTKKGEFETRFALDGDRLTVWSTDQGFVVVSKLEAMPEIRTFGDYIDIRAPALIERLAVTKGWFLDDVLNQIREFTSKYLTEVKELRDSVWSISWRIPAERFTKRWTLEVDTKNFTPLEYRCEAAPTDRVDQDDAWFVVWKNKDTWTERDGIWIPTRHEYHHEDGPFSRVNETVIYDYDWKSVNEAVDEKLFNHESFDLPATVGIQDVSGDSPILIRPPMVSVPASAFPAAPQSRSSKVLWLVAFNVTLVILWFGYLKLRRKPAVN